MADQNACGEGLENKVKLCLMILRELRSNELAELPALQTPICSRRAIECAHPLRGGKRHVLEWVEWRQRVELRKVLAGFLVQRTGPTVHPCASGAFAFAFSRT